MHEEQVEMYETTKTRQNNQVKTTKPRYYRNKQTNKQAHSYIAPDFRTGGFTVDLWVVGVVELLQEHTVRSESIDNFFGLGNGSCRIFVLISFEVSCGCFWIYHS